MISADPAISDGFMRTRSPFSSRYTLKPRFRSSLPVFHFSVTSPAWLAAVNVFSFTLVGKVMISVWVAVLFDETGSGSFAVTEAEFTADDGVAAVTVIVIVAVPPL